MAQSSPARHRLRRTALTVLAAAVAAGLLAVPTAAAAQTQVAGRELERAAVIPPLIRRLAGG
jgi:hypothetical protein